MMGHKTLFRVLLKTIGVYLLVTGLPQFAHPAVVLFEQLLESGINPGRPSGVMQYVWSMSMQGVITVVLGLYFFFGGKQVADLAFPGNHTYCGVCGSDLTHIIESHCPECGADRHGHEAPVES